MKRIILLIMVLALSISILACTNKADAPSIAGEVEESANNNVENEIKDLVEEFGKRLQNVSLLASEETLRNDMEEHYGELVTESLIDKWIANPENAPGRLVSSPWPDRIEIESIDEITESEYEIIGEIIEITNNENDEPITKSIKLSVKNIEEQWIIDDVILD